MTLKELTQAADDFGLMLVEKRQPYNVLTHCGVIPHKWFSCSTDSPAAYYYQCPRCGLRGDECNSEEEARIAWNKKVWGVVS